MSGFNRLGISDLQGSFAGWFLRGADGGCSAAVLCNSMAEPELRWIGERIAAIDRLSCTKVAQLGSAACPSARSPEPS